jgi:transposase-like protein
MSRIRKQFSKEEKLQIIEMSLEENVSIEQIASRFGIHANTLRRWRNEYSINSSNAFPGSGNTMMSEDQKKIEALNKELRERALEIEILKKAMGIFSSPNRKNLLS